MKLKRILAVFLAAVLIFSVVGCAADETSKEEKTDDAKVEDTKTTEDKDTTDKDEEELSTNDSQENTLVKFWGGGFGESSGFYDYFLEETGYTIENKVPWCDTPKLLAAIASGAPPDVLFLNNGELPQLASQKALRPLDDYFKNSDVNIDEYVNYVMDLGNIEGKYYAFPWDVEFSMFYWDKDMFEEAGLDPDTPPATWEELREYAKLLTKYDSKGDIVQAGFKAPNEYRWFIDSLIMANGGNIYSDDVKSTTFNTPEVIETFEFLMSLSDIYGGQDGLPEGVNFHWLDEQNVAMTISDAKWWGDAAINQERNIGFGVLPAPEGKDQLTSGWATWSLVLPEKSANPQGGFEFGKWMSTRGVYLNAEYGHDSDPENWPGTLCAHIPSNTTLNDMAANDCTNEYKLGLVQSQINIFENYVVPKGTSPIDTDLNEKFEDFWKKLQAGEVTIQDGLAQLDQELTGKLEEYYRDRENMGISD